MTFLLGNSTNPDDVSERAMTTAVPDDVVKLHVAGRVRPADVEYARRRIAALARYANEPILSVRVKLTRLADPALERPMLAQVNVDLNGRIVRAQVERPTMREAIDEAYERVRDRLQRFDRSWQASRGARPLDGAEWRHASMPTDRPQYFPRPVSQREVVRRKSWTLERMTVDEAALDIDLLDYDFYIFTEVGSEVDSILYRTEEGLRLAQLDPRPQQVSGGVVAFTVSAHRAPRLGVEDAVNRLNATGWPFVFFRDAATGRGAVLYHRYDGHYGLIHPATNE